MFSSSKIRMTSNQGRWSKLGSDLVLNPAAGDTGESPYASLSGDGNTFALQGGSLTDKMRIYSWNGSSWTQKGQDINFTPVGQFPNKIAAGVSLNTDGTVVAVACPNQDADFEWTWSSSIRIYAWNGSSWTQRGSDIVLENTVNSSDRPPAIRVGFFVSLSGDGTTVTFKPANLFEKKTRVYKWNGSSWTQMGSDIDVGEGWDDMGPNVSLSRDGTTLAVGAAYFGTPPAGPGLNGVRGAVRVYRWNGSSWIRRGADINGDAIPSDASGSYFGHSVKMNADGTVVAVGAPQIDGGGNYLGRVKVFAWNGSSWTQRGSNIDGKGNWDNFGEEVSLGDDGNVLAATGRLTGQVRAYAWNGSSWIQRGSEIPRESSSEFSTGRGLCLNADASRMIFGVDGSPPNPARVRVYRWG